MRFLADENFPGDAVAALRLAGYDVAWIKTIMPSAGDRKVLEFAEAESRVLLTFDKDFGELAWRYGLPATCGIVLFRLHLPNPATIGSVIASQIEKGGDWSGRFSVIADGRIRSRPIRRA